MRRQCDKKFMAEVEAQVSRGSAGSLGTLAGAASPDLRAGESVFHKVLDRDKDRCPERLRTSLRLEPDGFISFKAGSVQS